MHSRVSAHVILCPNQPMLRAASFEVVHNGETWEVYEAITGELTMHHTLDDAFGSVLSRALAEADALAEEPDA